MQLLTDDRYANLIDEFYFEHHVFLQELAGNWAELHEWIGVGIIKDIFRSAGKRHWSTLVGLASVAIADSCFGFICFCEN